MVENVLFLDSEHVVMGVCSHPKKLLVVYVICLVYKLFLLDYFFLLEQSLGMQPKSTNKISHNSKDSV